MTDLYTWETRSDMVEAMRSDMVEAMCYKPECFVLNSRSRLGFLIDIILLVNSASNRNEYQEYFLQVKGGQCIELTTLPPLYAKCLKIW
jgi:hypothetical protein